MSQINHPVGSVPIIPMVELTDAVNLPASFVQRASAKNKSVLSQLNSPVLNIQADRIVSIFNDSDFPKMLAVLKKLILANARQRELRGEPESVAELIAIFRQTKIQDRVLLVDSYIKAVWLGQWSLLSSYGLSRQSVMTLIEWSLCVETIELFCKLQESLDWLLSTMVQDIEKDYFLSKFSQMQMHLIH